MLGSKATSRTTRQHHLVPAGTSDVPSALTTTLWKGLSKSWIGRRVAQPMDDDLAWRRLTVAAVAIGANGLVQLKAVRLGWPSLAAARPSCRTGPGGVGMRQ